MNHKVFIPVTDEILYDYPELITAPLRPYQVDNPCYHWMATVESVDVESGLNIKKRFDHTMLLNQVSNQISKQASNQVSMRTVPV